MIRWTIFLALGAGVVAVQPGEPFKPGKLSPADQAALEPGLTLRFYAKASDAKPLDARRVRLAALHIPKDTPPSPFIAPGPVHAKLSGYLKNPLKGDYRFRLSGTGTMILRINDVEVLKGVDKEAEVELAKNYNKIEIVYTSSSNGDSTLRLDWAGEKFGFEPAPPEVLFSRNDDADLMEQTSLREGRQLFARIRCGHCHGSFNDRWTNKPYKMPETIHPDDQGAFLRADAPRLDYAGDRFQTDWLVEWILNPRALRPEATMPRVLHGMDAEKDAADIAAYLTSLKRVKLKPLSQAPASASGEALFKKLGCNTCHRLDDPKSKDELERLSLFHVNAKFAANAIGHFLQEPNKRYTSTRMPDFRLTEDEASHLEAYLRDQAKGTIGAKPKGDVARGEKLFSKSCRECHTENRFGLRDLEGSKKKMVLIASLEKGCLSPKDHGKAPDFGLNESQRSVLTAFLKTDGSSLTRETPAEFSQRQVKSLQCNACHRRDGEITRWHAVLEEDGKEPEKLPSLTWVGEKLKPAWTKKLLAGQGDYSARPWIKARMPAFPARAEMLAVGLSHEHGFGIDEDKRPPHDAKLAAIGEKLIPQQGGFNCINCHGIGKTPPTQPFEAPGINLLDAAIRLRHNYYQRWMLAPDRVDVTLRMPIFATDGKTTQIREVFDGDARRQYDALWHYIQTLPAKNK